MAGDLAFVANSTAGLQVIDVSDPVVPRKIGSLDTPDSARDVEVVRNLAFVADSTSGLRVIDVSDPATPWEIGSLDTPDYAYAVEIAGDLAFVADRMSGLRIIDVSDPTAPQEIGFLDTTDRAQDVAVAGDLAFVAGSSTLHIIDVSDPTAPRQISTELGTTYAVEVMGDLVLAGGSALRWVNVSNPSRSRWGTICLTARNVNDVEVVGSLAYVADSVRGVVVCEITDPVSRQPELGAFSMPSSTYGAAVSNGLAFVATRIDGLRIIDFGPEYQTTMEVEIDIKPGSDPNSINLADEGVIPVAILGSDTFDVNEVDVTTMAFGPDGAAPAHCHGPHLEDVNGDGYLDLLSHFRTDQTGIAFGVRTACLTGEALDGTPLRGCDSVRTVPDMDGDGLLDVDEAAIGTHAFDPDTDEDGFEDGEEVLVMGTDPLNPHDPVPVEKPKRRGRRRR